MSRLLTKTYDVPVGHLWYEIKLEVDQKTAERRIFVDLKEMFHQKGEGEFSSTDIPIGEESRTKNLRVIIDTNLNGQYEFDLIIDGIALDNYLSEYTNRYKTWIIQKLGSKSKLTFDEQENEVHFKREKIQTEKIQPSFEVTEWRCKHKEEYEFRIIRTLIGIGEFDIVLYVNGEENNMKFVARFGADA